MHIYEHNVWADEHACIVICIAIIRIMNTHTYMHQRACKYAPVRASMHPCVRACTCARARASAPGPRGNGYVFTAYIPSPQDFCTFCTRHH